ncbi:hypothetical protein N7G274_007318 [Stereocaulon virgatum]|uniref:Uncharacterized protein n=1 Tax=Stereocaulon virgatum TaxID=373712 RepID=A0ABR4A4B5_9LECA
MKWTLLAVVGILGVATATPAPAPTCSPSYYNTCPTKTLNIVANFDDLEDGYQFTKPYDHLSWFRLTVRARGGGAHRRGLIPHTKPNYAVAGPYPELYHTAPYFNISGTKTTSFDFTSFYAGCIVANQNRTGYAATNCQFTVDCLVGQRHQGPYLYTYTPSSATAAPMTEYGPGFTYCYQADFSLYTSGAGPANTLLVIDSVNYTIREGETFLRRRGFGFVDEAVS